MLWIKGVSRFERKIEDTNQESRKILKDFIEKFELLDVISFWMFDSIGLGNKARKLEINPENSEKFKK
jgi:hypothetical protein